MEEVIAAAPVETAEEVKIESDASADIDFEADFLQLVDAKAKAEVERDNYKKGMLKAKGKLPEEEEAPVDIEELVDRAVEKRLPKLQASIAQDAVESTLEKIASTEAERKVIRLLFEDGVGGTRGTIRERLENAKLIANKQKLIRTNEELRTALGNRAQISTSSTNTGSEGPVVKDSFLSAAQLAQFKKMGWGDQKIELFKKNYRKNNG